MDDEIFFRLRMAPEARIIATRVRNETEIIPQLWFYEKSLPEGRTYRAVVSLQGHKYSNFSQPDYRRLLLRGIAWAGRRPADLLTLTSSGQ